MGKYVRHFDKAAATPAHGDTIWAAPILPEQEHPPVGHAYGYLEKAGAAMEPHRHPTYEFYLVLEGHGFVEVDGEREPVGPGDYIEIPRNALHSMICKEDSPFLWAAFWWE